MAFYLEYNGYEEDKDKKSVSAFPLSSPVVGFPNALNYRTMGKVTSVKNQGSCGSCWAFSATAAYESALLLQNRGSYDLSEQFLLQCTPYSSCAGGYPQYAMAQMGSGMPTESAYRYYYGYYNYSGICSASNRVKAPRQLKRILHYTYLNDNQIKQILYTRGPVSVALYANSQFTSYSSGIFSQCPYYTWSVNHAVLLVGYTSAGHWIIKNSWGSSWGDNGYMIINKYRNCGIGLWVDAFDFGGTYSSVSGTEEEEEEDPADYLEYTVEMEDSAGDGWNGQILGVKQQGKIFSTFGEDFTSGNSKGPQKLKIKKNVKA